MAVVRWPHYLLDASLIGISAYLALSGGSGYGAQLLSGVSTPTGLLGTLSVAAPIVTLLLFLNCLGARQRLRRDIFLTISQIYVLTLSGFRGAAGLFIFAAFVGAAVTLPEDSNWRRKSRLLVAIPILMILLGVTFILGAQVKNAAASSSDASSVGSRLLTSGTAFRATATRLQLSSSLDAAISLQNDPNVERALSWVTQLHAAVPRVLWPGKPIVDYGQRVAVAVYSRITTIRARP